MQAQERTHAMIKYMQRSPECGYLPDNDHNCACPVSGEISTGWGRGSGFALISWKQARLLGGEEESLDDNVDVDVEDASGTSESFSAEAEAKRQDQFQLQIFAPATKAGLSGIREPHH